MSYLEKSEGLPATGPTVIATDGGLATFFLGLTIAFACTTFIEGIRQSRRVWARTKHLDRQPYIILIWTEWTANIAMATIGYLIIIKVLKPSLVVYFFIVVIWITQIQCIMHIMMNRVALIMYNPQRARWMKWGVTTVLGLINLSGFLIWIPSQLAVNETWIRADVVWDRLEKAIFALTDLSLNLYFIYLVRINLVAEGLTRYRTLYKANIVMVFVSISLDITLIGLISAGFVFVQFHPVVYLVKLSIEMSIADLIAKIAKAIRKRRETSARSVRTEGGMRSGPDSFGMMDSTSTPIKKSYRCMRPCCLQLAPTTMEDLSVDASLLLATRDADVSVVLATRDLDPEPEGGGEEKGKGKGKVSEVVEVVEQGCIEPDVEQGGIEQGGIEKGGIEKGGIEKGGVEQGGVEKGMEKGDIEEGGVKKRSHEQGDIEPGAVELPELQHKDGNTR